MLHSDWLNDYWAICSPLVVKRARYIRNVLAARKDLSLALVAKDILSQYLFDQLVGFY